jgi:hypothetical protein
MNKKLINCLVLCLALNLSTNIVQSKELDVIEVKDLKGGVQKTLPTEPKKDTTTLLKGRVQNQAEFHILNEIQLNINDVRGPGKDSSSMTDGTNYFNNLNIYGKGNLGKLNYQFNMGGRATSDNRVDVKGLNLTTLQGKANYGSHTVSAGDVFESFSQYSLNTNLKGASYKFVNTEDNLPDVTAVYGMAYPRWDSMFRAKDVRTMQRAGYGANARHEILPNLTTGFSFLRSQDGERQSDSDPLYENNIYSFDYEYAPAKEFTLRGESAFSRTHKMASISSEHDGYYGSAHRAEAILSGKNDRVNLEFERVSPTFETFLGSAAQDREKAKVKWKHKHSKNVTFNSSFLWYMNKLRDGQSSDRNQYYRPEVGVNVKRLFHRKYSEADLVYRFDRRAGKTPHAFDQYTNLNYRDRFGFLDVDTNMGLNTYNTSSNQRETYEYNYSTALSSRHNVGIFVFKPSLNAGTNFVDDDLNNTVDKIVEYSAGLGIDVPKYKVTSNMKFGQNILNTGIAGGNNDKMFANISIYYKPSFIGYLNNSTLFIRFVINDFNFQTRSRNFSERSIVMGFNMPIDLFVGKPKKKPERL